MRQPSRINDIANIGGKRIRYIGGEEVDWFVDRRKIVVPKDFDTVERHADLQFCKKAK